MFLIGHFVRNVREESVEAALGSVDMARGCALLVEDLVEGELRPVLLILRYFLLHHLFYYYN